MKQTKFSIKTHPQFDRSLRITYNGLNEIYRNILLCRYYNTYLFSSTLLNNWSFFIKNVYYIYTYVSFFFLLNKKKNALKTHYNYNTFKDSYFKANIDNNVFYSNNFKSTMNKSSNLSSFNYKVNTSNTVLDITCINTSKKIDIKSYTPFYFNLTYGVTMSYNHYLLFFNKFF